jgi:Protein of unknown function (DUF1553)/Protein of unknown function (DUF1549)/Planctomycete cytochrome C
MSRLHARRTARSLALLGCAGFLCASLAAGETAQKSPPNFECAPNFERDVAPILKAYCWHCHGGEARRGGLDVRTLPLILQGGNSGPAIVPGSSQKSLIFRKFGDLAQHPPRDSRPTPAHIATLRAWIDAGAPADYTGGPLTAAESPPLALGDRKFWAFRTPVRPAVPAVRNKSLVRNPIDAFLLAKLESRGLSFSPPGDRAMFIRRASFDLLGLPPTVREIDEFVADPAPDAYDRLIERLLASPHYGERWGRHWLDAAGYVDTRGIDNDAATIIPLEGIWKYRDYVIRCLNEDRPYNQFVTEQLAGDEMFDWRHKTRYSAREIELLTATGFLRQAADVTYAPELNTSDMRNQVLFDTVHMVASNLVGLTVHCAQCHSHKFDPIAQADYYRLAGLFMPAYDPLNWLHSLQRTLADIPPDERVTIDRRNATIDSQIASLQTEMANLSRAQSKVPAASRAKRAALDATLRTTAARRTQTQKKLVAQHGPTNSDALDFAMRRLDLRRKIASLEKDRPAYGIIQALWDIESPPPSFLYRRGDFHNPGARVEPGVIAVIDDPAHPFQLPAAKGQGPTGYRTAFAKWLTSDRHPLTARVYVNRMWMHHFGTGIVATPDNFGASGVRPTHPELLDWLAREFIASGWDIKHLHRLMMTSTAYRQTSQSAQGAQEDPDNQLLWKMPLKRLESEIVRDAILAASGSLETRMGGPSVPLQPNADGSVEINTAHLASPADAGRRSVYVFARRNYQLTELGVFDQPTVAVNCTCRTNSAVVCQSLALLNGRFSFEQAALFARRVKRLAGQDQGHEIEMAFRIALGRCPTAEETTLTAWLLKQQADRYRATAKRTPAKNPPSQAGQIAASDAALADLCHMLINTNEFLHAQ